MLVRPPAFRQFSSGQIKPPAGNFGMGPMLMMGAGLAGFAYLGHSIRSMNANKAHYMAEGQTYMSPLVQQRIGKTLGFFSYGVLSTSAFVYAMRNSMAWASVPWYAMLAGSMGLMYACHAIDYETAFPVKLAAYTAFTGMIGLSILPLV